VERQLDLAIRALVERDNRLAEEVIAGDSLIDQREVEVDHRVIELIVRARPMARDLRLVMTAIKIAPDLERWPTTPWHRAATLEINRLRPLKAFITIRAWPRRHLRWSGRDWRVVKGDSQLARNVIDRDAEVDWEFEQIFRELLTYMMEDPKTIRRALALLMVSRALERLAITEPISRAGRLPGGRRGHPHRRPKERMGLSQEVRFSLAGVTAATTAALPRATSR